MAEAAGNTEGAVLTVSFELAGQSFVALNGGPYFPFYARSFLFSQLRYRRMRSMSFWAKLLPGGQVLMDLGRLSLQRALWLAAR